MNLADGLPLVIEHFFPDLIPSFSAIEDPRDPRRSYYLSQVLIGQALAMGLTLEKSARQANLNFLDEPVQANIGNLLGIPDVEIGSAAAVTYLLKNLPPEHLESLVPELVRHLLRAKTLDRYRFGDEYLVGIDGVEVLRWTDRQHCPQCLTARHSDGTIDYFHQFVDTKLLTHTGMALSLGFTAIENESGDYDKQSCETLAGRQALRQLKKRFPHARFCILGDALYACDDTITLIKECGWGMFLSFVPGRIPLLYEEAEHMLAAHPRNSLTVRDDENQETRVYRWVTNLNYRAHQLHAVFVDITKDDGSTVKLSYLTDYRPDRDNVQKLVDLGGRQRAKIENSFNTQKNHGYRLENVYSSQGHALKNYYAITQISHMIHQFMTHTDLLSKLAEPTTAAQPPKAYGILAAFDSLGRFLDKLATAWRAHLASSTETIRAMSRSIQIRFVVNTS
jgi:hypothetical protein